MLSANACHSNRGSLFRYFEQIYSLEDRCRSRHDTENEISRSRTSKSSVPPVTVIQCIIVESSPLSVRVHRRLPACVDAANEGIKSPSRGFGLVESATEILNAPEIARSVRRWLSPRAPRTLPSTSVPVRPLTERSSRRNDRPLLAWVERISERADDSV